MANSSKEGRTNSGNAHQVESYNEDLNFKKIIPDRVANISDVNFAWYVLKLSSSMQSITFSIIFNFSLKY